MRISILVAAAMAGVLLVGSAGCRSDPEAPTEATGLIVSIEPQQGQGEVESFEVEDGDRTLEIRIDPGRDYGFDLGHLYVHELESLPVIVELEERQGALYAVTIEDA